jgi:hypothetical protein
MGVIDYGNSVTRYARMLFTDLQKSRPHRSFDANQRHFMRLTTAGCF